MMESKPAMVRTAAPVTQPLTDLQKQCMRVLRCTAKLLASTPGGLRYRAGSRPWLDVLTMQALGEPQ